MQRQYWKFFWPLSLTGVVMLLARQFQNGTLARYEDAASELKIFALASSVFFLFNATLVFVPQMANALARTKQSHRACLRFTLCVCAVMSVPMFAVAYWKPGGEAVAWIFGIAGDEVEQVVWYLQFFAPLILVNGLRQYYTGLLVQAKKTGAVTVLNIVYLITMIVLLFVGVESGWRPLVTMATAQVASAFLHLFLTLLFYLRNNHLPAGNGGGVDLTYGEVFGYFWPIAMTSTMFAMSRPIIYSFVNRVPDGTASIAALRVGFDLSMMFQNSLNQFRHFFVTFGDEDLGGVRRFMVTVMLLILTLMVAVVFSPVSVFILDNLLGVEGELLDMAWEVLVVLCLVPLVITFRNYYHGLALIERRTRSMAVGGVMRVVMIYGACRLLFSLGELNHVTAAFVLILGFMAEAFVVMIATKMRREEASAVTVIGDDD